MDPVSATIGTLALGLSLYNSWSGRARRTVTLTTHAHGGVRDDELFVDHYSLIVELFTDRDCLVRSVHLLADDGKAPPSWQYGNADQAALASLAEQPTPDFLAAFGLKRQVAAHTSARWIFESFMPATEMRGRRFHAEVSLHGQKKTLRSAEFEIA